PPAENLAKPPVVSGFDAYGRHDALGLAALVRRREVQPVELLDAAIERLERVNPALNAVAGRFYDQARRAALAPPPPGPFCGVPFVLKDLLSTLAGVGYTGGSRFLRNFVPTQDSELVSRYKRAGLVAF